jgi:replicative DNA helicase
VSCSGKRSGLDVGNSRDEREVGGSVPPTNTVAEAAEDALMGNIVLGGFRALHDALDLGLRTEHLGHPRTKALFDAAIDIDDRGDLVDVVTLYKRLHVVGLAGLFGGVEEIAQLDRCAYSYGLGLRGIVGVIRQHAAQRSALKIVDDARRRLTSGEIDASEWNTLVRRWADDLSTVAATGDVTNNAGWSIAKVLDDVEHEWQQELGGHVCGVSTGFEEWNQVIGRVGPRPGSVVTLAGRPGMGKSTLAHSWTVAAQFDRRGELWVPRAEPTPVLWACSEMTAAEITRSMIANVGSLERRAVESPTKDWMSRSGAQRERAFDLLRPSAITFVPDAQTGILEEIEAVARAWRSKHPREIGADGQPGRRKPALVVIDYLQRLRSRQWRGRSREEEINHLATSLKTLARTLDVVVLMLCQLNRDVEKRPDKRPQLADLRESGAIEQESDVVSFVYREHYYYPDKAPQDGAEIITAKNRKGPSPVTVKIKFEGKYSRFMDLHAPGEAPEWDGPSDPAFDDRDVDQMWG